ncbi:MAG: [FeFe] hydrogenase H-cluster radical SAM maturase HydE [Rhizomicrobium sp.]
MRPRSTGSKPFDPAVLGTVPDRDRLIAILHARAPKDVRAIRDAAEKLLLEKCGDGVFFRGLIEVSNACACDCYYCGIRKSITTVHRFTLDEDEIIACAKLSADSRYGSLVIQSGERADRKFIDLIARCIERIKRETASDALPEGLGITLSLGQLSDADYRRLYEAGAHRYLLRIESSNPALFAQLHPSTQSFASRVDCLKSLRAIGYQVGTGVMIGLPGQTVEDLADDILFFASMDIDMIGMGPFIPHPETPLCDAVVPPLKERILLSLLMIAATRFRLPDVNIAATTALQALDPVGREKGLKFGANVMMPQITPQSVRRDYQLYPGKPCLDENAIECRSCLEARIAMAGRKIGYNAWGDSRHAIKRKQEPS